MPNLTSVGISSGVPNSGTGTVSTIDALMADGGQATLGAKADAKSAATDVTPVSGVSLWKQISFSIQAAAASLAGTLVVATHAVTQSGNWSLRLLDGVGTALTSVTRGAQQALSVQVVDNTGAQITSFGGAGGTASNFGSAVPSVGTSAGFSDGTNMQSPRVFDVDSGAGVQYVLGNIERVIAGGGSIAKSYGAGATDAGTQRVVIASDELVTPGQLTTAASQSVVLPSDYGVPLATDKMVAGTTALTPKFALISVGASGDNSIVALVASKKIRVIALKLIASGTVNAKWRSNTTDKTGLSYFVANDGEVLPFNPVGWFETAVGEALQINLSAAVTVGGHITYVEV